MTAMLREQKSQQTPQKTQSINYHMTELNARSDPCSMLKRLYVKVICHWEMSSADWIFEKNCGKS